jgi:hypothetical protein
MTAIHSDTGLAAEANSVVRHPVSATWAPITRAVLREIAAGRWPMPPLMARRLVVRAIRIVEARQ